MRFLKQGMTGLSKNPDALGKKKKATCCSISAFVNLPTVERTMLQGVIKKELENSLLEENRQIKHLFKTMSMYIHCRSIKCRSLVRLGLC